MLICLNERSRNRCNGQNRNGAKFCRWCGQRLDYHLTLPVYDPETVVGPYRIIKMIGHGAFGAVYEALDRQNMNRLVALKETLDPSHINSFKEEFNALQNLHYDHLPHYYDMFEANGRGYIVMELIPGQDLKEVLQKRQKPLLEGQVLGYALQLCKALHYLHSQRSPILHRDIKPANIRLTPDGLIKLVDFGLLKVGHEMTRRSRRGWTPLYAAPEQQGGGGRGQTDPRSDLYSLGATLYHLLTNELPIPALERAFASPDPLPPPQKLNPSLSAHVAEVIIKAMALNPKDRYASAMAMKEAFFNFNRRFDIAASALSNSNSAPTEIGRHFGYGQLTATESLTDPFIHIPRKKMVQAPPPAGSIKTLVVSQTGAGDYKTISEAIQRAPVGSHILVRPGLYLESLIIDKQIEIKGDGKVEDIIVESVDASCLRMQCARAEVRGLTLRGRVGPKGKSFYIVDIPQGELLLEDCDISSESLACVAIYGANTNPVIRRCKIHDGKQAGLFIYQNGQGKLEGCDIFANTRAGVVIAQSANPHIQRCRIYHGKSNGIYAYYMGQGIIEECEIFGNAYAGVAIKEAGNPLIRQCKIYNGLQNGVRVYKSGKGIIEDCEIYNNARAGIEIKHAGDPLIKQCKIHGGQQDGIFVGENGKGTIQGCEIFNNAEAGVRLGSNANPVMQNCKIKQNKYYIVKEDGNNLIRLERDNLTGQAQSTWHIESRL